MGKKMKAAIIFAFIIIMTTTLFCISSMITFAEDYCTVTVDYLYSNGDPAYESYVAVFQKGENIDVTVRNPEILGYTPKDSLDEGAADETVTELKYDNISQDYTIKVYYVPREVPYEVRYFFQNISDDLYTENNSLDESLYKGMGLTGSKANAFPKIDGFTQLFYNEDAIAADGSTVYEVYYDRNYTLINFDLDGGYGVEPVYAKYGSIYTIAEPVKSGYVFLGWSRTNENGEYINKDGDKIDKAEAEKNCEKFTTGTIPANDEYYKAVWKAVETTYTIVYRVQNADDDGYSYAGSETKTVLSGTVVSGGDTWDGSFVSQDNDDIERQKNYFKYNDSSTEKNVTVEGDGSTVVRVYYDRKKYNIKFYYAWEKEGKYYISNETGNYLDGDSPIDLQRIYNMPASAVTQIADIPNIKAETGKYKMGYDSFTPNPSDPTKPEANFYYIEFEAKYGQYIGDLWPLDLMDPRIALNNSGSSANPVPIGGVLVFSTWAPPRGSYWAAHPIDSNRNVATFYERLDERVLANEVSDLKTQTGVAFVAYWSVTTKNDFTRWTQELYVPVLDDNEPFDVERNNVKYKKMEDYALFTTSYSINQLSSPLLQGYTIDSSLNEEDPSTTQLVYTWEDTEGPHEATINRCKTARFFYKRNSYDVLFYNGGETHKTVNVPFETPLKNTIEEAQENLTYYVPALKDFYTFDGWYTSPDFAEGTKFDADVSKMPAGGLILYAKWTPVKYNVTFYNDLESYINDTEIKTVQVERGDTVLSNDIPNLRSHTLTSPIAGARFSGWYYIDGSGNTVRFDPSMMPVTSDLKLYAGWESDVVSTYAIKYLKKGTSEEIAEPTSGRAFVSTTKTFSAKGGSDLNESGWWPTVPSHSILMRDNESDNEYTFEYIKKDSVWYRVRYVDASTNEEFADHPSVDRQTSNGVVSEKALYINGYAVDKITKSCVLVASEETDSDAAKNEETSVNVITFYYTKNDSQSIFEVNHYTQNLDNTYSLWQGQTFSVVSGTINMKDVYSTTLLSSGYSVNDTMTKYEGVVDVNPKGGTYVVIDIYYDRKFYPYVVRYIDAGSGDVIKRYDFPVDPLVSGDSREKHMLGNTVEWKANSVITESGKIYDRLSNETVSLSIHVEEDTNGEPVSVDKVKDNVINVYYRERSTFSVRYTAVCIPSDTTYSDEVLGGVRVSRSMEIVSSAADIVGSTVLEYPTEKCKFLGWFDNPDGKGDAISTVREINRVDIGNIDSDKTYYAVFRPKGEVSTLRIEKYIDSLYYNSNDNPHGFADAGVMQPKNDDDKYGYLNMTKAEQNFVFRIEKYEKASGGNKGDLVGTSYTVMTFGADDEPLETVKDRYGKSYRYMHSKDIMIEPGYIYTVTEVGISKETDVAAGLGWRYIFTGVTIPEMVSGTNRIAVVPTEPQVDVVYGDTLINAVQKIEFYAVRNNASNDTESDMSSITNKILIK